MHPLVMMRGWWIWFIPPMWWIEWSGCIDWVTRWVDWRKWVATGMIRKALTLSSSIWYFVRKLQIHPAVRLYVPLQVLLLSSLPAPHPLPLHHILLHRISCELQHWFHVREWREFPFPGIPVRIRLFFPARPWEIIFYFSKHKIDKKYSRSRLETRDW